MRWLLKHKKLIAAVLVVLAIVAMALWPTSIEVVVATVSRGEMQVTIDEDGETRVRDRFVVSAPVAGRLQRIELEPGDPVVRGRTIVARLAPADAPLLDPRTRVELGAAAEAARAAVGQAQAELARAATTLSRAKTTLGRQRGAGQSGRHRERRSRGVANGAAHGRRGVSRCRVHRRAHRIRAGAQSRHGCRRPPGRPHGGCGGAGERRHPETAARERDHGPERRSHPRDRRSGAN